MDGQIGVWMDDVWTEGMNGWMDRWMGRWMVMEG